MVDSSVVNKDIQDNVVARLKSEDSPDFIWTHSKTKNGYKRTYWIPYLVNIQKKGAADHLWLIKYNAGTIEIDLNMVDCLMIYGKDGIIPIEFLGAIAKHKVILLVHRRTTKDVGMFINGNTSASVDNLTNQIKARENQIKTTYIAKVLIREQIQQRELYFSNLFKSEVFKLSGSFYKRLVACKTVDQVRNMEAQAALRFWSQFFKELKLPNSTRREEKGPVQSALNAGSVFLTGVVLRWIVMHRLSPAHGYLHVQAKYEGLVFDLIEPFRWMIEKSVFEAYIEQGENLLVSRSIDKLKSLLQESVYCSTGQTVKYKTLLHGVVLSLCAYLKGTSSRFIVPVKTVPSKKLKKPGFKLPGFVK